MDPFDFSEAADSLEINIQGYKTKLGMEIYKCPSGHTIGLNLLSEVYISGEPEIKNFDIFFSDKKYYSSINISSLSNNWFNKFL